jgi:hypothetical protein
MFGYMTLPETMEMTECLCTMKRETLRRNVLVLWFLRRYCPRICVEEARKTTKLLTIISPDLLSLYSILSLKILTLQTKNNAVHFAVETPFRMVTALQWPRSEPPHVTRKLEVFLSMCQVVSLLWLHLLVNWCEF